ncbi:hypothetical protein KQX54_006550 [Cotesia glomerata]|uniref:Uncharacterized protein n=1 Tax=Cotesia glomerata TaxID=32391 RepID=A0AAV7J797_COTGL|nr:hypothetical protein KQX54_006550 [Cotesia glomerata]
MNYPTATEKRPTVIYSQQNWIKGRRRLKRTNIRTTQNNLADIICVGWPTPITNRPLYKQREPLVHTRNRISSGCARISRSLNIQLNHWSISQVVTNPPDAGWLDARDNIARDIIDGTQKPRDDTRDITGASREHQRNISHRGFKAKLRSKGDTLRDNIIQRYRERPQSLDKERLLRLRTSQSVSTSTSGTEFASMVIEGAVELSVVPGSDYFS